MRELARIAYAPSRPGPGLRREIASCGHTVWVTPSIWSRAAAEGNRLLCGPCIAAIAEEHNAIIVVRRTSYR